MVDKDLVTFSSIQLVNLYVEGNFYIIILSLFISLLCRQKNEWGKIISTPFHGKYDVLQFIFYVNTHLFKHSLTSNQSNYRNWNQLFGNLTSTIIISHYFADVDVHDKFYSRCIYNCFINWNRFMCVCSYLCLIAFYIAPYIRAITLIMLYILYTIYVTYFYLLIKYFNEK